MKVVVIGGAGAMARTAILDLNENPKIKEILIADYQKEKAKSFANSFGNSKIKASFVDAYEIDQTAELINGYDIVINAAQHYVNIPVMKACLKARCHYNDLGGLFYTTQDQLKLFGDFKKAGLTAVLCIGSAPGITNILARFGYDRLDSVKSVRLYDAIHDMTDMMDVDVFLPGYSIRTIMDEMALQPVQFINGEHKKLQPLSGAMEIDFPEPIGRRTCVHTLHSEPLTIPSSFKDKGVKEVTWRLSLPPEFEERANFLASIGFAAKEKIRINNVEIVPVDVLAAVIEKQVEAKLKGITIKRKDMECLRGHVTGVKDGKEIEYIVDCIARTHSRWGLSSGDVCTGVPPAIVAQMQVEGMISEPGVWAPEQIIDPNYFFKELTKREMEVVVTRKEALSF